MYDRIKVTADRLDGVPRSSALAPLSVTLIGRPGDAAAWTGLCFIRWPSRTEPGRPDHQTVTAA
jgi:hypothetical protein